MGSQPPLGIHLLRHGVLHGLQVDICSTMDLHGLQVGICSTMDLHGLQGDSLPHHGLYHGLQGNLCSSAWSTSCPSFFTDLGVCRQVKGEKNNTEKSQMMSPSLCRRDSFLEKEEIQKASFDLLQDWKSLEEKSSQAQVELGCPFTEVYSHVRLEVHGVSAQEGNQLLQHRTSKGRDCSHPSLKKMQALVRLFNLQCSHQSVTLHQHASKTARAPRVSQTDSSHDWELGLSAMEEERAPSNLTLNVSRDGASTTSLGNLFQCLTTLIIKNFFLISSLNLSSFSLKPLLLFLSLQALLKSLFPLSRFKPSRQLSTTQLLAHPPSLPPWWDRGENQKKKVKVFQPSDHFCGPPLDPLQQVHVFPVLRTPELDAVLQVGSHQSRVEGQNHLPRPAGHASFDAAQDMVGLLGCERTLLAHVWLFIHQYLQVLLSRTALNPFIPQPVLIPGVAPTQGQDPALGLVEPHEVHIVPLLQLVQVPLDGILSLRHVNRTTQLGVICKLAEGALNPAVYVIDEDTKQYWSQYGPLRDTTRHRSPFGH
ncbi:hypothetical protein QYF61_003799 [Mycteria americana]|uniref:Uncharacterized protein n=1 Tax=Mycteria americana TaxID=33587 RepID=A0AAN7NEW8_MYCAM|nr:hypothetical protein QYF61_003799 [Mycteria americana]